MLALVAILILLHPISHANSYNDTRLQLRTPNNSSEDPSLASFQQVVQRLQSITSCDASCCLCYASKAIRNGALGTEFAFGGKAHKHVRRDLWCFKTAIIYLERLRSKHHDTYLLQVREG